MKKKTKIDPYTGLTFEAKRRNQVFATRQNRIDYHNEQAAQLRDEKAPLNKPLHENLKILKITHGREKRSQISQRVYASVAGFSFMHNTHSVEYKGKVVFAIYGYLWYREVDEKGHLTDYIKIVCKMIDLSTVQIISAIPEKILALEAANTLLSSDNQALISKNETLKKLSITLGFYFGLCRDIPASKAFEQEG
jgi:hypothetical protein